MSRWWLLPPVLALLAGCGHYRDFTLPTPAGVPSEVHYIWKSQSAPVLLPSAPPEWDAVDVLNPSVIRRGSELLNLYSGFDGKMWRTGLATSMDGVTWTKAGLVLQPDPRSWESSGIAANGSVVDDGIELLYYYQAGEPPRIGLARSSDGRQWTKFGNPVLPLGPRGSWDERGVADAYVIRAGKAWYLYYLGMDRARRQRLGIATSTDGLTWYKLRSNPVLGLGEFGAFDENGLGEPAVWAAHGDYWMLYTGRDRAEVRRLGLARSRDGVHWEKTGQPIGGSQAWNAKTLCDPTVLVENGRVRVWFGGGDIAHPAENVHGRIGIAELVEETGIPAGAGGIQHP
ncbi:MAG: hypothetical protein M3O35_13300 [Acidobacteriota bacterium]|nr:hypothetical protein [Acidobacteriota bacterium]